MTDIFDVTEDETEVAEATEETTDTQPEQEAPTPEQIAQEWLKAQGIEDFDPKKVRNLTQWERDLNKKSSELGSMAKVIEAAPAVKQDEDDALDPETAAELKKALKAIGLDADEIQSAIKLSRTAVDEGREEAFTSFIESHDDVDPADLIGELMESGIDPNSATPAQLKRELNKAYKVVKAAKLDPEAIKKQAIADYIAGLADKGAKPADVVEVKKGRGSAAGAHRDIDQVVNDPSVSLFDKFDALA